MNENEPYNGLTPFSVVRRLLAVATVLSLSLCCSFGESPVQGDGLSRLTRHRSELEQAPNPAPIPQDALAAAGDLIERMLPGRRKSFVLELIAADSGNDVFELESRGGKIVLRGNNGVAIACALNWYLKYFCQCQVGLKASQLALPKRLPEVHPKVRRVSQARWRYFLNYCCFGYSLPWYDWPQWERLIDWMALNGINAPLSVTGQEAVWAAAGRRLGFTDAEVAGSLAGPPYLPFAWMGCLDGWGGPVSQSWIERHVKLQQQILARERALGMRPVLQAFAGHVPPATGKRYPGTTLHELRWAEWPTYMLDPLDPLFGRFADAFIEEQRRLFGTSHLYAADTFIEMSPSRGDTEFLAATGRAIYNGMAKTDPEAVWVLQGWTFLSQQRFWTLPRIEAFLGAVPNDHMLVLDLHCDKKPVWQLTRAFCGKNWAWCALQNFGDCVYLGGALDRIRSDLPAARRDPSAGNLIGLGFVNEGLDYNPVVYDFLFEQAWRSEEVDLETWLQDYSHRAYGVRNPDCEAAWVILRETVYSGQHQFVPACASAPSLEAAKAPPYSNERLMLAWRHLLNAADAAGKSDAYRFDLVSVTRQVLANFSGELQRQASAAFRAKDVPAFNAASQAMLEIIRDTDTLLATRREYLLGRWLEGAKSWGENPQERARMEWNARRLLTLWGEVLPQEHRDYARREWAGMLTGFYLVRWEKFFNALKPALQTGEFDERAFDRSLQDWENAWAGQQETYSVRPKGDSLKAAKQLWEKYEPVLRKSFKEQGTGSKN